MKEPESFDDCYLCGEPLLDASDDEICLKCHLWLREETERCAKERGPVKPKPKKRPSGAAQIKSQGKAAVLLRLTPEQLEVIDAACAAEGRSRTNYIAHHAAEAARKLHDKIPSN